MKRTVQPEMLDALPPDDPRAVRSRRDLRRVNAWMRNHAILIRALQTAAGDGLPRHLTELGAGDGQFLLRVARELAPRWPGVSVTLLDQRETIADSTLAEFAELGWHAQPLVRDVRQWIEFDTPPVDIIMANLFLHHFAERDLARLLLEISKRCHFFAAVEPRRAAWPLFCSRLLWLIGCNKVTCYDAPISVHAGFARDELSALWPATAGWDLMETNAGGFSHLFVARRKR
ncbi:MAG: methyltransferase domain-containing protein [Pedosphaera sp.]|nr:methyltransferase domain-containing protein [Pedosphaera sp.]